MRSVRKQDKTSIALKRCSSTHRLPRNSQLFQRQAVKNSCITTDFDPNRRTNVEHTRTCSNAEPSGRAVKRRRSADEHLLGLHVHIPPGVWTSVSSDRGLCGGPITRPEKPYRLLCDLETSKIEAALARVGLLHHGQTCCY